MVTTEIKDSLKKTLLDLRTAEDEMNRPFEDVVTLSICLTARRSMNTLMHLYLKSREIDPEKDKGLQDTLAQCKKADSQFEKIDMSKILCNGYSHSQCEDKHCITYNNVEECVTVAKTIKELVLNKLQLKESELV